MCGILGIKSTVPVAKDIFFALYSIQHRGQESCGIATVHKQRFHQHKSMGLLQHVFNEQIIQTLPGSMGIGHVRYSTEGTSTTMNCQPILFNTRLGPVSFVQNGSLVHYKRLREKLINMGICQFTDSDSEVIAQIFSTLCNTESIVDAISQFIQDIEGAFSLILMTSTTLYAFRDRHGIRPLMIGKTPDGWMFSSESCAFDTISGQLVREVAPGELVYIDTDNNLQSHVVFESPKISRCIFEYVYFSRPDSIIDDSDRSVHLVRQEIGRQLAREQPVDVDLVIGVPDSALAHAIGYAEELGVPYNEGLTKNRYIARTFIQPDNDDRKKLIRLKYNPICGNLKDRRIVLVDDSIIRGNTMRPLVAMLRNAGCSEIHVRVASPPVNSPCYMGINMRTKDEMIANHQSIEEMEKEFNVESLRYLSLEGLEKAVAKKCCTACFSGQYPIDIEDLV